MSKEMCLPGLDGAPICVSEKETVHRKPVSSNKRLTASSWQCKWGEQIVGSENLHDVSAPIIQPGSGALTAYAVVESGAEAFHTDWKFSKVSDEAGLDESSRTSSEHAIRIRFAPTHSGNFKGELVITVRWEDGHIEKQRIALSGSARDLDQVPATEPSHGTPFLRPIGNHSEPGMLDAPQIGDENEKSQLTTQKKVAKKNPSPEATTRLQAAKEHAGTELTALGNAFSRGKGFTKDTAANYRARPESDSIWLSLAKMAVMAGMTPIASAVGTLIGSRIIEFLTARSLRLEVRTIAPYIDADAVRSISRVLERPIRKLGEGAFDAAMAAKAKDDPFATEAAARFFAGQQGGIDEFIRQAQHGLTDQWVALTELLGTDPELAISLMKALEEAFTAHAAIAENAQAEATARAWVTFRARDTLGAESVHTPEGSAQVTKLSEARDWTHHGLKPPGDSAGLLDIHVTLTDGVPRVDSASLDGIAQPVADILLDSDLRTAKMPIRIIVGRNSAIITVDELGRARVSGALVQFTDDQDPATVDEAKAHRGAQRVVDQVIGTSLRKWGLQHVTTDDANGETGTKK